MKNNRIGVTLVELMIVVAIVGILAALGSIGYSRYIKAGKVEQLKVYAQEVLNGQEGYRSRNNSYFPASGGTTVFSTNPDAFRNLLDFTSPVIPGVEIETESWDGSNVACTICDGIGNDETKMGSAVRITQDLDGDNTNTPTTIVITTDLRIPNVLNEGQ